MADTTLPQALRRRRRRAVARWLRSHHPAFGTARGAGLALGGVVFLLGGCAGPLDRDAEETLRDQVLQTQRAMTQSTTDGHTVELQRPVSEVDSDLTDDRKEELDHISGVSSYQGQIVAPGANLMGMGPGAQGMVRMSLQQAVATALAHNIELQQVRLQPAIADTQVTQAQAAFDAVFFATPSLSRSDEPRAANTALTSSQISDTDGLTTGIRKPLTTGGQVTVQTAFAHNRTYPSSTTPFIDVDYYTANVELSLQQPLLRGFGSDINRAQIVLAQSGRQQNVLDTKRLMLELCSQVEQSYWSLVLAQQSLLIQERLLERTIGDYERIRQRENFDVNPVRKTEAAASVEQRRGDVIRARQQVRVASDTLKRLINDPDLPLAGETLIDPSDLPADAPIQFSLLDAVTTALRSRPEVLIELMKIKDMSVRMRVADNARLPQLNLQAGIRYNSLGAYEADAYDNITDGNFVTYLLGAQFEMPIGNRAPEAQYQQTVLQRRQQTIAYQKQVQDTVLQVKNAMRRMVTAYELIGAARAARRSAADNLRSLERQEDAGVALTPEFLLDLKLRSQERVADTEIQEAQALTEYNSAVADYYRVLGTLLDRDGISFADPMPTVLPAE